MSVNQYPMPPLRPEVERDGYGRYILPNPDEPGSVKSYTRATTMAGAIADKWNIFQWQRRMIVEGLATSPELLNAVDLDLDQRALKDNLTQVADDAHEAAGGNDASARGTMLHYFTEAVDGGHMTVDEVPGEYRNEVQAYVETMRAAGITIPPDMIERILLNLTVNVAGTADRQHVIMPNGTRLVADVKTGKDLSWNWNEIAMQLAIYAHAEFMLAYDADGEPYWDGVPEVDQRYALVMHVPVDQKKCKLFLVDLVAGWAAVELALDVREYRSRRNLARPLDINAWLPEGKTLAELVDADTAIPGMSVETPALAADVPNDPFAPAPGADPTPDEQAIAEMELTPLDEARREYDRTKAEIANLKAEWPKGKRRTKAQIDAEKDDDFAQTDPDGVHTVQSYGILTRKLRRAYKLDEVPMTAPPPKGPEPTPQPIVDGEGNVVAHTSGTVDVLVAPLERENTDQPPVPTTKYGTAVTKGSPRPVECTEAIDHADPTSEAMSAVYAEYEDVWEQFHTDRAQARIDAAATTPEPTPEPAPEPEPETDPAEARLWAIAAALDKCTTQAEMSAVYSANEDVWTQQMTDYGMARLAQNG